LLRTALLGRPDLRHLQLHVGDLITRDDFTYLALSSHHLRVAPAAAGLRHAQRALAWACGARWLFPGAQPGQFVSSALGRKLHQRGLPDTCSARPAALISLVAELPAAVLADLLRINIHTAENWPDHARYDWAPPRRTNRIRGSITPSCWK
jgi:hypothetical protein